jgi:hypothetical protein
MFRSYDHLQADIYIYIYMSKINTTDNGSVVFKILVNLVDNCDRFLVTVDVVAVAESTIVCCICIKSGFILVWFMFLV